MNVLVLNSGSSSIKFSVLDVNGSSDEPGLLLEGELSGAGEPQASLETKRREQPRETRTVPGTESPAQAIRAVLDAVIHADVGDINAVGYRVVHPGPVLQDHALIDDAVLNELNAAADFAPLHDPEAIEMIREAMERLPHVPHVACFDTVFHQTMPEEASTYAIPENLRDRGVKRYGFHGLSCESVVRQMLQHGPLPRRMVIAHLGSGCSVTAVRDGVSIDTTMGLTPTGGVVMGTRPGDMDPGLMLYLLRQKDTTARGVEQMLNHHAGMVALTALPNDMKVVRKAARKGDVAALLALTVFTRSVTKAIGGFAWLMGGVDAIVFTGGIGEHDAETRAEVLAGSEVSINPELNHAGGTGVRLLTASDTKTAVFAVPAQEDLVIALHVRRMVLADA